MIAPVAFGAAGVVLLAMALRGWMLVRQVPGLGEDTTPARPRRQFGIGAVLAVLGRRVGPLYYRTLSARRREKVHRRILTAGQPGGFDVHTYAERKSVQLVLYGGAAFVFMLLGAGFAALFPLAFGLIAEDIRLSRLSRLRREEIDRSLPDFLDVLAVVVSAGLSFRQGLARVAGTLGGPLGEEIQATLRQLELGVSRREAFLELRDRSGSGRVSQFVTALLQAEELGAPLAETLLALSGDQRRQAAQDARRRAARAAPRVSLVVSLLIVPGAMVLLVASLYYGTGLSEHGLFPQ